MKEISRLSDVEFMVWLLLTALLQVYSEKSKGAKGNADALLGEKKSSRKFMLL